MLLKEFGNFIDPIHDNIPYSKDESLLISHPIFQRLHKIKQLGTVHTVYPAATHSRFSHSLGVMHTSGLLFKSLFKEKINSGLNDEEFKSVKYLFESVRIAALLHDVGHGPYSHDFEMALKELDCKVSDLKNELADPINWATNKTTYTNSKLKHEHYSYALIGIMLKDTGLDEKYKPQDICCFLDNAFSPTELLTRYLENVCTIYKSNSTESLLQTLKAIQSSDIDADRLDYLQRDSFFCGINIAAIDIFHILSSVALSTDNEGNFFIKANKNSVQSIDQTLISRKLMFDRVYLHWEHCFYGSLLTESLYNYGIINKNKITSNYKEYILFNDEKVDEAIKNNVVAKVKSFNSLSDHQKTALFYYYKIKPKKHHQEEFSHDFMDFEIQKLEKAFSKDKFEIVSLPLKDFSNLQRSSKGSGNDSPIRIEVEITKKSFIPYNKFSDVFKSSLWLDIKQRATAIDSRKVLFDNNKAQLLNLHQSTFTAQSRLGQKVQSLKSKTAKKG